MLSRRINQLAPPPRPVPLRLACRTVLGLTGGLGAVFTLIGTSFAWVVTADFDPTGDLLLALRAHTTQGVIMRVTETNTTENDVTVYRYDFSFQTPSEESYTGTGYTRGRRWSAEERVTIEYAPSNPAIARIRGTRRSMVPFWAILLVLIFPAIGAYKAGLVSNAYVTLDADGSGRVITSVEYQNESDMPKTSITFRADARSEIQWLDEQGQPLRAEVAAKNGDGPKALEHLQNAGQWALDVALKIGVPVAIAALKTALGV